MQTETWKDIPEFEGRYQASDHGRIKSIARVDRMGRVVTGKILKGQTNDGYLFVNLYRPINNRRKVFHKYVHRLVFYAFNGFTPEYIDHINNIRYDNRLLNLESVTARENTHRWARRQQRDLPIGVHLLKSGQRKKKYQANIMIDGKQNSLGLYLTPEEASSVYQNKLNTLAVL